MSALFRSTRALGLETPLSLEWDDAELTTVVVLSDYMLGSEHKWVGCPKARVF